jgi:hypothetical protein
MSKTTKAQVKGVAKTGNAAKDEAVHVPSQKDIDTNCGTTRVGNNGRTERKEMSLVDRKISAVNFETIVNINPIYSKDKDKWYLSITIGQKQDKQFFVTARKDGKGVCVMTDFEEYMFSPKKKATPVVVEC